MILRTSHELVLIFDSCGDTPKEQIQDFAMGRAASVAESCHCSETKPWVQSNLFVGGVQCPLKALEAFEFSMLTYEHLHKIVKSDCSTTLCYKNLNIAGCTRHFDSKFFEWLSETPYIFNIYPCNASKMTKTHEIFN